MLFSHTVWSSMIPTFLFVTSTRGKSKHPWYSSSSHDCFPEVNAVGQEARDWTVHSTGSSSPQPPSPNLAGPCLPPHLLSRLGWGAQLGPWRTSLHYRDVHKVGRAISQARKAPEPQPLSSRGLCSWPCLTRRSARHVNLSVKDTIDTSRQYAPRSLGLWVGLLFFICFCFFVLKLCLYPHLMENVPLG